MVEFVAIGYHWVSPRFLDSELTSQLNERLGTGRSQDVRSHAPTRLDDTHATRISSNQSRSHVTT
jgi:hypothetical protein